MCVCVCVYTYTFIHVFMYRCIKSYVVLSIGNSRVESLRRTGHLEHTRVRCLPFSGCDSLFRPLRPSLGHYQ